MEGTKKTTKMEKIHNNLFLNFEKRQLTCFGPDFAVIQIRDLIWLSGDDDVMKNLVLKFEILTINFQ